MKLFLNNLVKGLMVAFVVICLGGFVSLKINIPPSNVMYLVSSSLVNSINTDVNDNIGDGVVDNIEKVEEKEVEVKKEETKEENLEINEENIKDKNNNNNDNNKNNNIIKDSTNDKENNTNSSDKSQSLVDKKEEIVVKSEYNPNLEVVSTIEVIETYHGKMTGYGPDCYGCSGITASGMNVMNGNIYYNDKTFGNIRIVAGDRSIPFGSIIKITGISISTEPVIAIVLDRGGMIGFQEGKHSYFDLLYESEQAALSFGYQDATFELLRRGY